MHICIATDCDEFATTALTSTTPRDYCFSCAVSIEDSMCAEVAHTNQVRLGEAHLAVYGEESFPCVNKDCHRTVPAHDVACSKGCGSAAWPITEEVPF